MKTQKILTLILCTMLISGISYAQRPQGKKGQMSHKEKKEKVEAMKVAYITEKLTLSTEEAEKFWPIYNGQEEKKQAMRKSMKADFKKDVNIDEMTDEEVNKHINTGLEIREKELALQKQYIADLKKVLPIKKIAKLQQAEKDFKKELLRKIRKGGPNDANIPPPDKKE